MRIVAHSATAARPYLTDNQWHISCIGKMEGIGHHLALEECAEIVFFLVKFDNSLFVGSLGSRFGTSYQVGREIAFTFIITRRHQAKSHNDN
jgi:hypothetical protein